MKPRRTYLIIAISSIALAAVLFIQVNWIIETARIKEEIFNDKAGMVLSRTADAIGANTEACKNLENDVGSNEKKLVDSLLNHYMNFYNFHVDYTFEVVKPDNFAYNYGSGFTKNVYNTRIDDVFIKNGLELKLILPDKKQFILAEMGTMFITSVLLIVVVLIMFWRTTLSLMREKIISEHTTDFLNNMTHEFKTPLTNIALAGKMIQREPLAKDSDKIKHYSGIILEENEKLRHQVERVLSMTALEKGEIPLHKTLLDFHELLREVVNHIKIQVENKQGMLVLLAEASDSMVHADKMHYTNAIYNLIDNAIKYSPDKPEITIRTYNSGNQLVTEISDKGIGIEKEFRKNVFDKYFRVPTGDVHNVKGFGLGLAYVKMIAELHGGSIGLLSEKGTGTTFKISIPNG